MANPADPFDSRRFVFEERPAANHRGRVHFASVPQKATPSLKRNATAHSANGPTKSKRSRWCSVDRILRATASILAILVIVMTAFQTQYADPILVWLEDHVSPLWTLQLQPQPRADMDAISSIVQQCVKDYVQGVVDPYVEQYILQHMEPFVDDRIQHVQQYVHQYIGQYVKPSLDSIPQDVRTILRHHLSSRRDYALEADGARIVPKLTTGEVAKPRNAPHNRPDDILRDNLHGGRCWTIPGTHGQVGISVSQLIYPSHITVDYPPAEVAEDIQQAPRRMRLWGSVDGSQNGVRYKQYFSQHLDSFPLPLKAPPIANNYRFIALADFEYDINAIWHVQTFPVYDHIPPLQMDFGVFVIEVLDNWGGSSTCIYRIRIHGSSSSSDEL